MCTCEGEVSQPKIMAGIRNQSILRTARATTAGSTVWPCSPTMAIASSLAVLFLSFFSSPLDAGGAASRSRFMVGLLFSVAMTLIEQAATEVVAFWLTVDVNYASSLS